jgi:hypothetical protein
VPRKMAALPAPTTRRLGHDVYACRHHTPDHLNRARLPGPWSDPASCGRAGLPGPDRRARAAVALGLLSSTRRPACSDHCPMNNFHFHLPDWPPKRLVSEGVLSANLRHQDEELLDADTSPWPLVRGAVLAFLRHRCSQYDDRLRGEHNQALRDSLAVEIAREAYRRYPWIAQDDPRPFAEPQDDTAAPLFTELARDLAHDHGLRDHLSSAIRDLQRGGNKQARIETLQKALAKIEKRIERNYEILTGPKYLPDAHGGQSRGFSFSRLPEEMGQYCFFDSRVITPNRYHFLGFRCPQCNAPVVQLKQPVNFGQGFRMVVSSCFCRTLACVCPPAGRQLKPVTLEGWDFREPSNPS